MRNLQRTLVAGILCTCTTGIVSGADVTGMKKIEDARIGITVFGGKVTLPRTGIWTLAPGQGTADAPLAQLQLKPPAAVVQALQGKRMAAVQRQQMLNRGASGLMRVYSALREAASQPKEEQTKLFTYGDLSEAERQRVAKVLERSPWRRDTQATAPFYFLLPDFELKYEKLDRHSYEAPVNRDIIAVELHPYLDDGMHWVLRANGRTVRMKIDVAMAEKYGYDIEPVLEKSDEEAASASGAAGYEIYGLRTDARAGGPFRVKLTNHTTGGEATAVWDFSQSEAGGTDLIRNWASMRLAEWRRIASATHAPVLKTWIALAESLYGTPEIGSPGNRNRRTTSLFNVLGGRAAIRETLQMRSIGNAGDEDEDGPAHIPISSVKGVEVESHPFEEMAGDEEFTNPLPLSEVIPIDRFFLHVSRPSAIVPLLERGSDFLFRFGSLALGNAVARDLTATYLSRLGMHKEWLQAVLKTEAVSEMALMLPDLFLVDGTDVTVVARVPHLNLMRPFFAALDLGTLQAIPAKHGNPDGSVSYWAAHDDLLLISTSKQELQTVLDLAAGRETGTASLGESAEWRAMTARLHPRKDTRYYAYLSDAFIRRLVGPAVKIGQLRRLQAKADLETITASALLYKHDGHDDTPSLRQLGDKGYLPKSIDPSAYSLRKDLSVVSAQYGNLSRGATLLDNPVENVTAREVELYEQYRERYSNYWRQYFDPIVIRIDDAEDGSLAMHTFILPLLDSRLYSSMRQGFVQEDKQPLRVPRLKPAPVLSISMQFGEPVWREWVREMGQALMQYTGLDSSALDTLGPAVHFALRDAQPVVAFGSGDLLGVFGSRGLSGLGNEGMLMIPILAAGLTRPCSLLVQLQDGRILKNALAKTPYRQPFGRRRNGRNVAYELVRIGEEEEWLYTINLFETVKLRYGVALADDYMTINNLPWAERTEISALEEAPLDDIHLRVSPGRVEKELPALHTAFVEKQRVIAMQGIGYLTPLLLTTVSDVKEARREHRRLFGYYPIHPGPGTWEWREGKLHSTTFGSLARKRQPPYRPGREFGLFKEVQSFDLSTEFQHTGLRTILRWRLKGRK